MDRWDIVGTIALHAPFDQSARERQLFRHKACVSLPQQALIHPGLHLLPLSASESVSSTGATAFGAEKLDSWQMFR